MTINREPLPSMKPYNCLCDCPESLSRWNRTWNCAFDVWKYRFNSLSIVRVQNYRTVNNLTQRNYRATSMNNENTVRATNKNVSYNRSTRRRNEIRAEKYELPSCTYRAKRTRVVGSRRGDEFVTRDELMRRLLEATNFNHRPDPTITRHDQLFYRGLTVMRWNAIIVSLKRSESMGLRPIIGFYERRKIAWKPWTVTRGSRRPYGELRYWQDHITPSRWRKMVKYPNFIRELNSIGFQHFTWKRNRESIGIVAAERMILKNDYRSTRQADF